MFGGLIAKNAGIYSAFAILRKFTPPHRSLKKRRSWRERNPVNNSGLATFGD